jgi:hypothetical protein
MNKKKVRVLHCIFSLSGGGAERQLCLLAGASDRYGVASAIFHMSTEEAVQPGVQTYNFHRSRKFDLKVFSAIFEAARKFDAQLFHTWLPPSVTIPTMLVARAMGKPCVFSYRNAMRFRHPVAVLEYLVATAISAPAAAGLRR